jgi:hypothetical protein
MQYISFYKVLPNLLIESGFGMVALFFFHLSGSKLLIPLWAWPSQMDVSLL